MKTFQVNKWKIETEEKEVNYKTRFTVKVYNTNAKVEWKQLKYYYGFGTEEARNKWVMDFVNSQKEWEQTKLDRRAARKADHSTDITVVVKKALATEYGFKNVRVYRGTGTGWGWVHAKVTVDQKEPKCESCQTSTYGRCYTCSNKVQEIRSKANHVVYEAIRTAGVKFYTYYSDDPQATEHDEFMLDVNFAQ